MNSKVKYWLRWICVLPGALILSFLMYIMFIYTFNSNSYLLGVIGSHWYNSIVAVAGIALGTCSIPIAFAASVSWIAPAYKDPAALVAFLITALVGVVCIVIAFLNPSRVNTPFIASAIGYIFGDVYLGISLFRHVEKKRQKRMYEPVKEISDETLQAFRVLYGRPDMTKQEAISQANAVKIHKWATEQK